MQAGNRVVRIEEAQRFACTAGLPVHSVEYDEMGQQASCKDPHLMMRPLEWGPSSCVFRNAHSTHSALSTHCTDLLECLGNAVDFLIQLLGPCAAYSHREDANI